MASDPVGLAVVGYGYWGANQARNVASSPNTRLVCVVDGDPERRAQAQSAHPDSRVLEYLDDALADEAVEGVVLVTPAATHAELARRVLNAGRHVLVEKPLAMTVEDAVAVEQLGAALGLQVVVGHTFLYSAPVRKLRQIIDSGDLGEVRYLAFQRLSLGRIRSDCNVLWNLAPHDVSIALHLVDSRPSLVNAAGFCFLQPGIEDVVFGTARFDNGVGMGLQVSWIDPKKIRQLTVVGSEKMAVYDDVSVDRKIEIFDVGVVEPAEGLGGYANLAEWQWKTRAGDIVIPRFPMWEPLRQQIDEFALACRTAQPPPTAGRHGVDVVRVLAAMTESIERSGIAVDVLNNSATSDE